MAEVTTFIPVDREQFSLHPEDDMTESRSHSAQAVYLEFAISQAMPELFVARNLAVYWVPGQREHPYAGPDILVSRHHPQRQEDPTVYLTYEDGPLTLDAEIASDKTRRKVRRERDETYAAALQVPEYLLIDIPRQVLQLWALEEGRYVPMHSDSEGRLWSRELELGFAWQEDRRLVRVLRRDGTALPTAQEAVARMSSAELRAEALAAEVERLRRAMEAGAQE
jgi:Uma2 family endonuclease